MDKKTLYEKAEKAINHAFEMAKTSVKTFSEKAGETAHVAKLLLDKTTLEHRVTKQFAQLGNRIYEKALREGKSPAIQDPEIKNLIEETKKLDIELSRVEATIEGKRREKKSKK